MNKRLGIAILLLLVGCSRRGSEPVAEYLKDKPAPRWLSEGIPYLKKDEA